MNIELKKLSIDDGKDIYDMLQEIPSLENGFNNGANGRTYEDYKKWLFRQNNLSSGIGLEDWMVPCTTYWLYVDDCPVGFGKIRDYLTDKLREEGGHIGYGVRPSARNKGYGKILLQLLLDKAKEKEINEILITVYNDNQPSLKVAKANGGQIEKITEIRHYFWFYNV